MKKRLRPKSKRMFAFDSAIGAAIVSLIINLIFVVVIIATQEHKSNLVTAAVSGIVGLDVFCFVMVVFMQLFFKVELQKKVTEPIEKVQEALDSLTSDDLSMNITREDDDRLSGIYKSIEKIRKELELYNEQQKATDEIRRIYVNGLMHDIATPITRINGCASMISDGMIDSAADTKRFAKMILQNTQDIENMLKNLAQIPTYDNAVIQNSLLPIDMSYTIGRYIKYLKYELASKNATIKFINLCGKPPVCKVDVRSCKRVFMNLVNNSVKYMRPDEPCEITVTLQYSGQNEVLFSFEDNGIGIEPGTEEKIFEMFYRGDSSRHDSSKGNGIGLFISREILKSNNAEVWAERKEKGLIIKILFPIVAEPPVDWFEVN